jgi:regulator of cell morphogenesis and NO signaling
MTNLTVETPVGRLVAEHPRRARLFERLGIDYCCGGSAPLERACQDRGLDLAAVLHELAACEDGRSDDSHDGFDAAHATMVELIDHIVAAHHGYLRRELPRLTAMAGEVLGAHRTRHPELKELLDDFGSLREELTLHMLKEEKILFPVIARLETAAESPQLRSGSILNPILLMKHEHNDTGGALARLRALTDGYAPPADACPTYRAMLHGMAELEADLHVHIHEENNILFPRALAAEDALEQ